MPHTVGSQERLEAVVWCESSGDDGGISGNGHCSSISSRPFGQEQRDCVDNHGD